MGRAISDIVESVERNYEVRWPVDHQKQAEAHYNRILKDHLRMDDTTRPLLKKLHESGQKMAVGSNGTRDNVINTIAAANFEEFFPEDHIFTFEMLENPKPSTDLYLHVCEVLHTDPSNAIVIEDTVAGATAGIEANIDTVGYVGLSHRENQAERLQSIGCNYIIESMQDLSRILYPQGVAA